MFLRKKSRAILVFALWILLIGTGFFYLISYQNRAGTHGNLRFSWPRESHLQFNQAYPVLLLFLHPQCSCSKATLGELERLMPYIHGKVQTTVLFVNPNHQSQAWVQGDLWQKAAQIPGVQVIEDSNGQEAVLFGAQTSGHVFLYTQKGQLIFSGGITPARGHMGDSSGRDAVLNFIRNGRNGDTQMHLAKVFGCSLKKVKKELEK